MELERLKMVEYQEYCYGFGDAIDMIVDYEEEVYGVVLEPDVLGTWYCLGFKNAFDTYYKSYIENGYFEPVPTNEVMFDMFFKMIMAYNEKYKQEVPVARLKLKL